MRTRYYFLELCNASLEEAFHLKKYRGPLPEKQDILLQLAEGMKYIHEHGLIYMRAKPRNALIYSNKKNNSVSCAGVLMKWSDFGLSDWFLNVIFHPDGTAWLSPEIEKTFERSYQQPQSTNKSLEADVYSEGLVFVYVLLDGEYPKPNDRAQLHNNSPHLIEGTVLYNRL